MPDNSNQDRKKFQQRLYRSFQEARDAIPLGARLVPYGWTSLPDPLSGFWLPYSQMLQEYAGELANSVNTLVNYVHRLEAWSVVLSPLNDREKMECLYEFVTPLATAALGLPYVIKSRFAFAATQLCHQANFAKSPREWRDDLPTSEVIYLNHADKFCCGWKTYEAFKRAVEPIQGQNFRKFSGDFRNAYNHRFPRRVELGITSFVTRAVDKATGKVQYEIGGHQPISVEEGARLLAKERDLAIVAFEAFQNLVREQEAVIAAFDSKDRVNANLGTSSAEPESELTGLLEG